MRHLIKLLGRYDGLLKLLEVKYASQIRMLCVSLVLLLLGPLSQASESVDARHPPSPEDHLVTLLESIDALSAKFHQHSSRGEQQTGQFWLNKPNQFRLESEEPLSQTIVSDGKTLWTHDRDLEQVIISDMGNKASEIPILVFAGEPELIRAQYRVERFEDEKRDYFLLTPKGEGALTSNLSLTFENNLPLRMTLENTMGQQTSIDLLDVSRLPHDSTMFAATFTFSIPNDVDVIDDRVMPVAAVEKLSLQSSELEASIILEQMSDTTTHTSTSSLPGTALESSTDPAN